WWDEEDDREAYAALEEEEEEGQNFNSPFGLLSLLSRPKNKFCCPWFTLCRNGILIGKGKTMLLRDFKISMRHA
ncbi:unnamed protein product, partial [Musa textilis]